MVNPDDVASVSIEHLRRLQSAGGVIGSRFGTDALDSSVPTDLVDAIKQFHDAKDKLNELLKKNDINPVS